MMILVFQNHGYGWQLRTSYNGPLDNAKRQMVSLLAEQYLDYSNYPHRLLFIVNHDYAGAHPEAHEYNVVQACKFELTERDEA